jgi:carboxyl-terminal processing protease
VAVRQRWFFLTVSVILIVGVVVVASGAVGGGGHGLYRLVGMFGQVVSLVRSSYVDEVPIEKLETGAMSGLVEAADPGGFFVPNADIEEYARVRNRNLPPFGIVLGVRSSYPFVLQVVTGSPADKAGILPGELIERISGEPVRARPLWRALTLLNAAERRGEVTMDVIDRQLSGKRPITVTAAPYAAPVAAVHVQDGVPMVRVPVLDVQGAERLAGALQAYAGASGVVVDLRGVALGTPDGAVKTAVELAGGDVEIRLAQKGGKDEVLQAKGGSRPWKVVVCLDNTTAGAAELLATALKARGATLVGGESYGDTGVRRPLPGAGGEAWMASAWGIGPDGKALLGTGIKPDERVRPRKGSDTVLERALELAGGQAAKQAA